MIVLTLIISFILEGIFTNLISMNSLFIPFFSLTALIILYPYFNNRNKFILASILLGVFYDIIYTSMPFVNTFTFVLTCFFALLIYNYINMNWININILNIIMIIFYRIFSYILLCLINFTKFNSDILIKGIYSSIIINIIFGIVLYIVTDKLGKKLNIRKVE